MRSASVPSYRGTIGRQQIASYLALLTYSGSLEDTETTNVELLSGVVSGAAGVEQAVSN
jgi:hypothetical protein